MVRIGARIHDLARDDTQNAAAFLKNSEVETVQLTLPKFVSKGEPVGGFSKEKLQEIKGVFDAADVTVSVLSCYINPLADDAEKEREKFFRYIDYAKEMGVSIVGTETGSVVSNLREFPKNHTSEVFQRVIDFFIPIVEYAVKRGLTVGIESVAYFPVHDEETFERFKNSFPKGSVCCIFDPTNLLHIGNYTKQREIFENFVKKCAADIRVVHFKDFAAQGDWLEERPLSEGNLDAVFVVELLRKYHVSPDFIIENAQGVENYQNLRKKLKIIMGE